MNFSREDFTHRSRVSTGNSEQVSAGWTYFNY